MNEKYIGDALLQKTVTTDFLTKKRVVNNGIAPQYYVENNHEAIIPREVYMKVQEEIVRRAGVRERSGNRHVYSGKHAFSSIICCAHCGDIFQRVQWFIRDERLPVWRCARRKKNKDDCPSRTVYESDLHTAFVQAVNEIIAQKDDLLPGLKVAIEKALGSGNGAKVADIDTRLEDLEKELLRRANANQDYTEILEQIDTIRGEKQDLLLEDANNADIRRHIDEIEAFLDTQQTEVEEYDEGLVRKLLERVTVHDDHLTFGFRSGIEIDITI